MNPLTSKLNNSTKPLIYLERQRDYGFLFKLLKTKAYKNAHIFFPYPKFREEFINTAKQAGLGLEKQIWAFSTISLEYDDQIYQNARKIAQMFIESVRLNSLRVYGSRHTFFHESVNWASEIRLHDQIVWRIRNFYEFRKRYQEHSVSTITYIPSFGQPAYTVFDVLKEITTNPNISMFENHLMPNQLKIMREKARNPHKYLRGTSYQLPSYTKPTKNVPHNAITFIANVIDRQYEATLKPLLSELVKRHPIAIFSSVFGDKPEWLLSEEFKPYFESGQLAYFEKKREKIKLPYTDQDQNFMNVVIRDFTKSLSNSDDPDIRIFANTLSSFIASFGYALMCYIRRNTWYFDEVVKRSSTVGVLPGRSLEANLAVGRAQARQIPTIEVQGGIISRTQRYMRPLADEFFALEPYSRQIVEEYFGKDPKSVIVTGGLKVEYDVSNARQLTQSQAREKIPQFKALMHRKILLHASQPVGVEFAKKIAEVAIKAAANNPEIYLVIKPHPNETESYLAEYRRLAKKYKLNDFMILQDANTLTAVVASDIVSTYFSTVGLESFALSKPVICVNPFDKPVPFDLVELGVAQEANNAEAFKEIIQQIINGEGSTQIYDPLLDRLRDGKVVDRVLSLIEERSANYKKLNSPMSVKFYARKLKSVRKRLMLLNPNG